MSNKNLPRILCLHGAGSNGQIFRVQGRKIFSALRKEFAFTFVESPLRSAAGPGMDIYGDAGPFYRWHCDLAASKSFDVTEDEIRSERDQVRELLETQLRKKSDTSAPVVGIMAFSQGARVAAGLLMHLAQKQQEGHDDFYDIKFAIFNSAAYPPLYLDEDMEAKPQRIQTPTLHIQGSEDPWKPESQKLAAEFFDPDTTTTFEFAGGHQLPLVQADADKVVSTIRDLAKQT